MKYEDFLLSKKEKTHSYGFEPEDLNKYLFDWQKECVRFLVRRGRAAIFADCGLGKTLQQLEWARQVCRYTGGNVLILAPLAVSKQTKREGEKFGYTVTICRSQEDVQKGINITNYEMLSKFEPESFKGVVLDESSILKSYMGATKRAIINAFKDTPYRLAATATPSPNDHMEILNQAEFLGVMKSSEALAIWFINDSTHSGKYRLKKHAVKDFWDWVSTWAICMSRPSDIGFSDEGYELPELIKHTEIIKSVPEEGEIIHNVDTSATGFHKEKKRTAEERAKKCAEIVYSTDEQYVVWCDTDYEADLLRKYIPDAIEVRGSQKAEYKEQAAVDFIDGKYRVLISKPKIFGYGLNFQNCRNCVFCGLSYSYENYYQAVRRFYRFGQTRDVNIYVVVADTEDFILKAVTDKQGLQDEMHTNMYQKINIAEINSTDKTFILNLGDKMQHMPAWLKGV